MHSPYTSNTFFHFVGHKHPNDHEANFEVLLKVLRIGCVSHPPHEESWGKVSHRICWESSLLEEKLIVPTVTCYADIPFDSLGVHIKKYGKFGVSFPRELLIRYGARPVIYIPLHKDDWGSPNGVTLLRDIEATYKGFYETLVSSSLSADKPARRSLGRKPQNISEAIHAVNSTLAKDFLAFIKPFNSHLEEDHPDNYYMEREWRKHGNLKFTPHDIENIVVAKDYSLRLEMELPQYKGKILEI